MRIARIELGGVYEELDCLARVGFSVAEIVEPALQECVIGFKTPAWRSFALRRRLLTRQELRPQRSRHGARDLILQREKVLVGPVVALSPLRAPVIGVDQLGAYSDHVTRLPHAALEKMRYSELRPDAAAILLGVPELKRRGAPDHLQPRELRKCGDQVF